MTDNDYLKQAIILSEKSSEDAKCACILVQNGVIIAEEYNSQKADQVAVHHAEVKAVYQANRKMKSRVLPGTTAYCSCEPCAMCLTALSYAKIERIVYCNRMADLSPDDPQSSLDSQEFIKNLNFTPKLEQILV